MSPKEFTGIRLESAQLEALRQIKDRDGVPVSEQIRRAIARWVDDHKKTDRKRAVTRKRP